MNMTRFPWTDEDGDKQTGYAIVLSTVFTLVMVLPSCAPNFC